MRTRFVLLQIVLVVGVGLGISAAPAAAGRVPFGPQRLVEAAVDQVLAVDESGQVIVTGPLACPAGEPAQISFTMVQEQAGASGNGEWTGTCVGGGPSRAERTQTWTTTVVASQGMFVPGQGRSGVVFHGVLTAAGETFEWDQRDIRLANAG